jgi:hypothetical protein
MTEMEYLRKKIREKMNDLADHLANDSCSCMEDYKYICGMIKALGVIEADIIEIESRNSQE